MEKEYKLNQNEFDFICNKLDKIETLISNNTPKEEKEWISADEAAKILGVGKTTLWKYRAEGIVKANQINKKLFFSRSELIKLIANSRKSK